MSKQSPKLVVVTGASTGMGAAVARELARQGFHVLAGVRRDRDADAIRSLGIEPVILDISEPEQVATLAARLAGDPRPLHALVNNAGIQVNGPVEALPMAQWRWVFEVNLFGHVAVTQALLPALLRSRGRVINISSIGGKAAMPTYGAYAGAKFALTPRPRTRYTIGRDAAMIIRMARMLPDRTLDRIIGATVRRHYPEAGHRLTAEGPRAAVPPAEAG